MKIETKVEKLKNSEIAITGSIPFELLEEHRKEAMKKMGAGIKVDGFREGKVPENILVEKLGEMRILNEMAELALQSAYPQMMEDNKIDAIGAPQVAITKLAPNNPLEFKITIVVMPDITLPDYKKIAKKEMVKKEEEIKVTDEEVKKTIEQLQQQQKQQLAMDKGEGIKSGDEKENLPEVNDEFVKKIGDFKDVADFKIKLKENVLKEKTRKAKEKKRLAILDAIAKDTKMDIPEILVEAELRKMIAQMKDDIGKMGLQFDKYLEHIKKTEDDLRKEWRTDAENRVRTQMVLNKLSLVEKINPNEDEVKKNTDTIVEQFKDAKRENVEIYVKMMVTNEEVFKFLEAQK